MAARKRSAGKSAKRSGKKEPMVTVTLEHDRSYDKTPGVIYPKGKTKVPASMAKSLGLVGGKHQTDESEKGAE